MNVTGERITIAILAVLIFGVLAALAYQESERPTIEVVCVEWLDAKGETGWMTAEEYDPIARMVSCGHLVREGDDFVILALDRALDEDDPVTYNQVGSIPRGMVQKVWRVQ